MQRNLSSAASETYNLNMNMFNYGQPEELFSLLRNFKVAVDGTGTTNPYGRINYLRTVLLGQELKDFDKLQS